MSETLGYRKQEKDSLKKHIWRKKRGSFSIIFLFILILGINVFGAEKATNKLYLDITFKENMFFDKYDVDLYVDNQKINTLDYASPFTMLLDITGKKHTITFYNASNHDYSGTETIKINENSTYQATIQTDSKKINIISSSVINNIDGSSIDVEDVRLMFLPDAISLLNDRGLNAVTYRSTDGKKIKKQSNWIVLSQSIAPGESIDKNTEVNLVCKKTERFISEKFAGLKVPDAIITSNEIPYEVSFIDSLTGRDMHNVFSESTSEELDLWRVVSTSSVASNLRVATLSVEYTGKAIVPDVRGMSLKNAIIEMNIARLGNIHGVSEDGKEIKEEDNENWKVISQSEDCGKTVKANNEITLYCESYAQLSEISPYNAITAEASGDKEAEKTMKPVDKTEEPPEEEPSTVSEAETLPEEIEESKESFNESEANVENTNNAEADEILPFYATVDNETPEVAERSLGQDTQSATETQSEVLIEKPTETPKHRAKTIYTVMTELNIRSIPSTDGAILGKYNAYDRVPVYEINDGWAQIDYNGTDAYVSAQYIQRGIINPPLPPEPVAVPEITETRSAPPAEPQYQGPMVWISDSGSKYHSHPSCSNMNNPVQVTVSEAQAMGRTPCKKCY